MKKRIFMGAISALVIMAVSPVKAQAEVSFAGETIEILVPADAGGGSDVYARLFAPYWTKYLPGNPVVMIRNMPGGGQTVGANFFDQRGPTDGTMLFVTSGSTHFPYLLGDGRARYDMSSWIPVLGSPNGAAVYTTPRLGIESWEQAAELQDDALVFASQGPTSLDMAHALSFELLGFEVQNVMGFTGRGPGRIAFERGETNIDAQTTPAYLASVMPLVEDGTAIPLYALGAVDADGNIQRDPTFPDLPSFPELYEHIHGEAPSGDKFDVWRALYLAGFGAQKHNVLPAGTAPEIVAAYREAAEQIVADPDFQRDAAAELGAYSQFTGDQAQAIWDQVTNFPEEDRAWLADWLMERFNIRI
ncbi:MAG: tricarboxylate transporter [Paracoccus sp. (in: a-proteobacteria)]|nr:tricarboxylate transporter [Paracoccus sp. (in: a-proteobacteria)]